MLPFELKKDTPYLALSGELWNVFYEYFNRNWPCYKGFLLMIFLFSKCSEALSKAVTCMCFHRGPEWKVSNGPYRKILWNFEASRFKPAFWFFWFITFLASKRRRGDAFQIQKWENSTPNINVRHVTLLHGMCKWCRLYSVWLFLIEGCDFFVRVIRYTAQLSTNLSLSNHSSYV